MFAACSVCTDYLYLLIVRFSNHSLLKTLYSELPFSRAGIDTLTLVPLPISLPIFSSPPNNTTLSFIPSIPYESCRPLFCCMSKPIPLSFISRKSLSGSVLSFTVTFEAFACLAILLSDSCRIRKSVSDCCALRSMPSLSGKNSQFI